MPRDRDCLAERGGFEPPRFFTHPATKFCPSAAHYSARKGASVMERTCCLGFGSSWISEFGDVEHQTKVWSSNLPVLGGSAANRTALSLPIKRETYSGRVESPQRSDACPVARFGRREPQGLPVAREWRPVGRPRPSRGAQFPWGRARSVLCAPNSLTPSFSNLSSQRASSPAM